MFPHHSDTALSNRTSFLPDRGCLAAVHLAHNQGINSEERWNLQHNHDFLSTTKRHIKQWLISNSLNPVSSAKEVTISQPQVAQILTAFFLILPFQFCWLPLLSFDCLRIKIKLGPVTGIKGCSSIQLSACSLTQTFPHTGANMFLWLHYRTPCHSAHGWRERLQSWRASPREQK